MTAVTNLLFARPPGTPVNRLVALLFVGCLAALAVAGGVAPADAGGTGSVADDGDPNGTDRPVSTADDGTPLGALGGLLVVCAALAVYARRRYQRG